LFFLNRFPAAKNSLTRIYSVSLYRNSGYLILDRVMVAATGFFYWILAARIYSLKELGLSSAAISSMSLLSILSTLGLTYGLIRFLPSAKDNANVLINTCLTIGILASISFSIVFLIGLKIWFPSLASLSHGLLNQFTFVIYTVSYTLMNFTTQIFIAKRRSSFSLSKDLIMALGRFIPLLLMGTITPLNYGIFHSWGIASTVALLITVIFFLPRVQPGYRFSPVLKKKAFLHILGFSQANYFSDIFWSAPSYILPLLLVNLLGAEQNAFFYICLTIATILFMIPGSVSLSLLAEGFHDESQTRLQVKYSIKMSMSLIFLGIITILLLGGKLLSVYGRNYSEQGASVLALLAVSAVPMTVNYIYCSIQRINLNMLRVAGLSAFILAATLTFTYWLAPRFGVSGAGAAFLLGQTIPGLFALTGIRPALGRQLSANDKNSSIKKTLISDKKDG